MWKPQPGQNFKGGLRYRESYGGVVSALQDALDNTGGEIKAYPNNFAGIIEAIEDLASHITEGDLPPVADKPPGWEIIIDGDGNVDGDWQKPPLDGQLWFDTRQGRLFIAIEGEYYQTNGADGIAFVSPDPPTEPTVVGQTWLDTETGLLYVNNGTEWQAIISDGDITLTTATLPLSIARSTFELYSPTVIPTPDPSVMEVQKDYNEYIWASLNLLDKAVTEGSVYVGDSPPDENVVPGSLWYDSRTLELSIYYQDEDSSQWVPTSVGYPVQEQLDGISESLAIETRLREEAIHALRLEVDQIDISNQPAIASLTDAIASLQVDVTRIDTEEVDLSEYAKLTQMYSLADTIEAVRQSIPDANPLATREELGTIHQALSLEIKALPYLTQTEIEELIPDTSDFVTQFHINESIEEASHNYMSRHGGLVTGSFIVQKEDIGIPTFDVSQSPTNSRKLFELQTYNTEQKTATYGATDNWWEVAWNFSGHEDFAWVYNDTNKVFSITKDGPACSALHIGTFTENDENGRKLVGNTIEVGETIRAIKSAAATSNDFAAFKSKLLTALANV